MNTRRKTYTLDIETVPWTLVQTDDTMNADQDYCKVYPIDQHIKGIILLRMLPLDYIYVEDSDFELVSINGTITATTPDEDDNRR